MLLSFLPIIQTSFFCYINRTSIMSPLFLIILMFFFGQYLLPPFILSFIDWNLFIERAHENQYTLLILNLVLFSWFTGFTLISNKDKFEFKELNFENKGLISSNISFGIFCLMAGLFFYLIIFIYTGYGFLDALANPLQFRFDIISLTGGYYIRNLALWLLNVSFLIILIFYFRDIRSSKKKLLLFLLSCAVLLLLLLPFGQRLIILIPFIVATFVLYNDRYISNVEMLIVIILGFFVIGLTGLYRTLAYFANSDIYELASVIGSNDLFVGSNISEEIIKRFDSLNWFSLYLKEESFFEYSRSIQDSIGQGIILLVPPVFLGGIEKQIDIDTYLTIHFLGSQDFGTFSFSPMSEWSMIFGKFGYVIMPFLSGLISSYLCNKFRLIKENMFHLIFLSSFMILPIVFIQFHSYSTANLVVFLIFNIGLYLFYKLFFLKKL